MARISNYFLEVLAAILPGRLTTNEIEEIAVKKSKIPRATFYIQFRKAKDNDYLVSSTNENHEVIWSLSDKGKEFLENSFKNMFDSNG